MYPAGSSVVAVPSSPSVATGPRPHRTRAGTLRAGASRRARTAGRRARCAVSRPRRTRRASCRAPLRGRDAGPPEQVPPDIAVQVVVIPGHQGLAAAAADRSVPGSGQAAGWVRVEDLARRRDAERAGRLALVVRPPGEQVALAGPGDGGVGRAERVEHVGGEPVGRSEEGTVAANRTRRSPCRSCPPRPARPSSRRRAPRGRAREFPAPVPAPFPRRPPGRRPAVGVQTSTRKTSPAARRRVRPSTRGRR